MAGYTPPPGIYVVDANFRLCSNVYGTANLTGGTVQAQYRPGAYLTKSYTIPSAAGGLGNTEFAGLTNVNLPAGILAELSYTTTDVLLNLRASLGSTTALSSNQQAVASALNAALNTGGSLPAGFLPLFSLNGQQLQGALDQLSPSSVLGPGHRRSA